jgi:putative tryptophan/tyrosine transport system substrate-binding protein
MRRRDFIKAIAGTVAAWPVAARAQQPAVPVIGYLSTLSEKQAAVTLAVFRRGLSETGLKEGDNVLIEYRWADGQYQLLPALAAELVHHPVSLILAQAPPAALAAKALGLDIPPTLHARSDEVIE